MPTILIPTIITALEIIGFTTATATFLAPLVATAALVAASIAAQRFFAPDAPAIPTAADGKYNFRQNVPFLSIVLGRVKKGGDYVFLEETDGDAHHVFVQAGHRIQGYVQHFLHDEPVTLNFDGNVTGPGHFNEEVKIETRLGLPAETAYATIIEKFPTLWTADHRGDGLASVSMRVGGVPQEEFQDIYPQSMPLHTVEMEGARLYDPRTGLTTFSTNLALFRLFHLTHPTGGKLTVDDLYLPDWNNAANVCDQIVLDRNGDDVSRYHGGFWYRSNNDPVDVGREIDQAGELVLHERSDGLIGVHAGEFSEPIVRLTADDVIKCSFDANKSLSSTVLAVRGRYTDPTKDYNTVDAAIYGDPYGAIDDETQRTRTFESAVVQNHNHCQRLQKLTFIRANAPRVHVLAHYEAAKNVSQSRFVTVHLPPRMEEAVVEVIGRTKLSLAAMTIEFDGIVVPRDLYEFDAATEEGEPGADIIEIVHVGVPLPTGFAVEIKTDSLAGGQEAAYAEATWDFVNDTLQYELEFQAVLGGPPEDDPPPQSVMSKPGESIVRTPYLADGETYQFRLRAVSHGAHSDWTDYIILDVVADSTAPGPVTGLVATVPAAPAAQTVSLTFNAPGSGNFRGARIYRNTANDFSTATVITTVFGSPGQAGMSYSDGSANQSALYYWVVAINGSGVEAAAVASGVMKPELILNGSMASDTVWTKGTGWTIAAGLATHAAGTLSNLAQPVNFVAGRSYQVIFTVTGLSAGTITARLAGGTAVDGTTRTADGTYTQTLVAVTGSNSLQMRASATLVGSIDNVSIKEV